MKMSKRRLGIWKRFKVATNNNQQELKRSERAEPRAESLAKWFADLGRKLVIRRETTELALF